MALLIQLPDDGVGLAMQRGAESGKQTRSKMHTLLKRLPLHQRKLHVFVFFCGVALCVVVSL